MRKINDVLKKLGEYKNAPSGNLKFKKCPFCGKEDYKFYYHSEKGVFHCKHGSCDQRGNFKTLCEKLGVENTEFIKPDTKKEIKKSEMNIKQEDFTSLDSHIYEYWDSRGISPETLSKMGVFKHKKKGIAYFYRKEINGPVVCIKYRSPDDKKIISQEVGGVPILWNIQNATNDSIIITEGEPDALTLCELGYFDRVVSVPFGTSNLEWITTCQEFLMSKKEIILCMDNDAAGHQATKNIIQRLPESNIKTINLLDYKDLNDFYLFEDKNILKYQIENPEQVDIFAIENLYNFERFNINDMNRFTFGLKGIDDMTRGIKESELIILAGDNGSGKTTFMKQIILSAREQEKKSWIFNGEIIPKIFKEDLFLQANGHDGLEQIPDELVSGQIDFRVSSENYSKINEWLKDKIYLFSNNERPTEKNIMNSMINAVTKLNCFFFVIDNLSVISYDLKDKKLHDAQGEFVNWCKEFAKKYNVAVFVINHMTKSNDNIKKGKDNIKGSGLISDVADMVITINRPEDVEDYDSQIKIIKNRLHGKTGVKNCGFSTTTKRIYCQENPEEKNKKYGWENYKVLHPFPF